MLYDFIHSLVNGESVEYNRKLRQNFRNIDSKFDDLMRMEAEHINDQPDPSESVDLVEVRSPYEVLGITEEASPKEIRAAFKKKSLENHPDRVGGLDEEFKKLAEKRMKEINAAYEQLRSDTKLSG